MGNKEKEAFYDFIKNQNAPFPKVNDYLEKVRKENQQKKEEQGFLALSDIIKETMADLGVIYE